MLEENEVAMFQTGFKMLNDKNFAKKIKGPFVSVNIYSISVPYNYTGVLMFKKKNDTDRIPTHMMVLFYRQFMFQFFLPFDDSFFVGMQKTLVEVPILPPILSTDDFENFHYHRAFERLDSELSKSVIQTIVLKPDTTNVTQIGMDLETKKSVDAEFDPKKVIKFILSYNGAGIKL